MSIVQLFGLAFSIFLGWLIVTFTPVLVGKVIFWYAGYDKWWSNLRRKSPPGSYLRISRGGTTTIPDGTILYGPSDCIYSSVPGLEFDPPTAEFVPLIKDSWFDKMGVVKVGFNKTIYRRSPRYNVARKDTNGKWIVEPAKRDDGYELFQHTLSFEEIFTTSENWPAPAVVQFAVEIWRPLRAEYRVGTWETQAEGAVRELLKGWFGARTIAQIRSERNTAGPTNNLSDQILNLTNEIGGDPAMGLFELVGIKIVLFRFVDLDLETGSPEVSAQLQKVSIAKIEGDAEIERWNRLNTASTAEAERILKIATAKANGYKAIRDSAGVEGLQLAGTEAFSVGIAGATTVAVGNASLGILTDTRKKEETR